MEAFADAREPEARAGAKHSRRCAGDRAEEPHRSARQVTGSSQDRGVKKVRSHGPAPSPIAGTTRPLSFGLALATVMLATACGGGADSTSAATLRSCVKAKLAPGTVTRLFTHTEEGVATTNYYYRDGSETDVNVFPSVQAAKDAEAQEARLGDAHDRRTGNVLHGGGGPADRAVSACLH